MSEPEPFSLSLSPAQAEAILRGLSRADGPAKLMMQVGDDTGAPPTVLVNSGNGEIVSGQFKGVSRLYVHLLNTASTAGDLKPIDDLGVPWELHVRSAQRGGSLRSANTDSAFVDLASLSGLSHLVSLGLQKAVRLRSLDGLIDLPAIKSLSLYYCSALQDIGDLDQLPGLENLILGHSPGLEDLSPVGRLESLQKLSLSNLTLHGLSFVGENRQLTSLTLNSCSGITDLSPLEGLQSLRVLTLKGAHSSPLELPDLSDLTALSSLTSLDLSYGKIGSDMSWLESMSSLEDLSLSRVTGITSVEWLNDAPSLRKLDLSMTKIVHWPTGPPLPALRELEIEGAPTDGFFERLTNLETLSIQELPSLGPIAPLRSLRHLSVGSDLHEGCLDALQEIESLVSLELKLPDGPCDLGPLRKHTELTSLVVKNAACPLDVSPLSQLIALRKLDIGRMSVARREERRRMMAINRGKPDPGFPTSDPVSLEPLRALTALEDITLYGRRDIHDLGPLADCVDVSRADLSSTMVSDLSPLSGWRRLERLWLRNLTEVTDLRPLSGLESLNWLHLEVCGMESLDGLDGTPNLRSLSVSYSPNLIDISALEHLGHLSSLELHDNRKVEDFSALGQLTSLTSLTVSKSAELQALPDLTEHQRLNRLNLSGCENLRDVDGLAGLTGLSRLDIDGCAALDITRMGPLLTLCGLTQITGNLTPAYRARIFAQGAVVRRDPSILFSYTEAGRRGEQGQPHYLAWRTICENDPAEPHLVSDVAAVCALALDRTEGAHTMVDVDLPPGAADTLAALVVLASDHPAEGATELVQAALRAHQDPTVRGALDRTLNQEGRPLPPGLLSAFMNALPALESPWATDHARNLRDRALIAAVRQEEAPVAWRAETAAFIANQMSRHTDEVVPQGYPVNQEIFQGVLSSLEADREDRAPDVEAFVFSALAMDHARVNDPGWVESFHGALTGFCISTNDDEQRNRLLSSLAAGIARCEDAGWAEMRLDTLLARAAEIDPDTSLLQAAVADAHASASRWDAAEAAAFAVARPGVRDEILMALSDQVLLTGLEDRARRCLSLRHGLVDPFDRRDALMALGTHEALQSDFIAYGQLMSALASDPEAQQTVAAQAVSQTPGLADAAPPDPVGPVTDRERGIVEQAIANRDKAWQDALGVEVPTQLRKQGD